MFWPNPLLFWCYGWYEKYDGQWWTVFLLCYLSTNFKYLYFTGLFLFWETFTFISLYSNAQYCTFYSTTFHKSILIWRNSHALRDVIVLSDSWTSCLFSMSLLNRFTNRTERFIRELDWAECSRSCSQFNNSLIQMIWSPVNNSLDSKVSKWCKNGRSSELECTRDWWREK